MRSTFLLFFVNFSWVESPSSLYLLASTYDAVKQDMIKFKLNIWIKFILQKLKWYIIVKTIKWLFLYFVFDKSIKLYSEEDETENRQRETY